MVTMVTILNIKELCRLQFGYKWLHSGYICNIKMDQKFTGCPGQPPPKGSNPSQSPDGINL
jgi:hypothetical protein